MKIYYFSSILLLTLFYMVNGQTISGVKTIPKVNATIMPRVTITTKKPNLPPKVTTTTTKKICPTAIRSNIERLCEERGGGKLIEDDCGFNSICLLPCGAGSTTTTFNGTTKTLTKTLPNNIIKDYYLSHSIYDYYVFCSCIYADKISNEYGPGKYTSSVGVCQEKLKALKPDTITTSTTTSTTTVTTTKIISSAPVITGKVVPTHARQQCEQNYGRFYMNEDGSHSVCFLPCNARTRTTYTPVKTIPTKTIPTTKAVTKTIIPYNNPNSRTTDETYCSCEIDANTTNSKTSTDMAECESLAESLGYVKGSLNISTETIPTKTTIPPTCEPRVSNNVIELCQERGGKLVTDECKNSVCLLSCGSSTLQKRAFNPTKSVTKLPPKNITTTPSKNITTTPSKNITTPSKNITTPSKNITTTPSKKITITSKKITTPSKNITTKVPIIDGPGSGFSSYLENYKNQYVTTTTTTKTKTIPTKILPSPHVIKDYYLKHGEFHGNVYCSCIYADSKSTEGVITDDMGECSRRLPQGDEYTITKMDPLNSDITITSVPAITSSTKCVQTVTVTEKELETVTVKETVTITVEEEPTAVQCAEKRGQCGGVLYTGPTCCPKGYVCHTFTSFYSECVEEGGKY